MQRKLAWIGAALLALALTACDDKTESAPPPSPVPSSSAPAPTTAPSSSSASPTPTSEKAEGSDSSVEGGIARYTKFLRALGNQDLDVLCDIGAPAAKKAEKDGFGPCKQTMTIMFGMISAKQKEALRSATIDAAAVKKVSATQIQIPAKAIKASVKFAENELGTQTLKFEGGDWFVYDS
ncbi:hypothetical protein SAMN05421504_10365 [Amycolatopsis xylanica]|uniref:Lipoprotein n=1 Tax=Amycolatopsis xylanica TaxID=589385 RepID=A0A1H3CKC9_9PSEU|nr:hypothetical protein [Amycolatopsis xylanica]SDX54613.1 hypothetical protein SAMN05421504_10365 [Amycolatopsis xylanica]